MLKRDATAGLILGWMGFSFIASHWEDIEALAITITAMGGTTSLAIAGLKVKAGR